MVSGVDVAHEVLILIVVNVGVALGASSNWMVSFSRSRTLPEALAELVFNVANQCLEQLHNWANHSRYADQPDLRNVSLPNFPGGHSAIHIPQC